MRSLGQRLRSNSIPLTSVPPATTSNEYSTPLASLAARILYRSPLPSPADLPIFILNAAAFPDAKTTDYDALLPYVLARLPDEEELLGGQGYEIIFFAGGGIDAAGGNAVKKSRPSWGWCTQAYHVLSRATRKRLRKLWIVHEKGWVRMMVETFATVVSPKFRKKVVHVSTISQLALQMPIEDLLIPPSAYLTDRKKSPGIDVPYASGRRAFGVKAPLPTASNGSLRLPRVLREATSFVITDGLIKTEGIFRVSARAQTVEILREAYDRGQKFIVWSEGTHVLVFSHRREGTGDVSIDELDQTKGYELHAAAALIKLWYKELHEPIFPQSSYQALEMVYGDPSTPLEIPQVLQMLSPGNEWTPLPESSRNILIRHLLPLLSRIAEFSDWNKMTPSNLTVCFAVSLLRGPDPIQDIKIAAIIRRILDAMITHWRALAPQLGTSFEAFEDSLRMPEAVSDREDPLEETQNPKADHHHHHHNSDPNQVSGILMLDNASPSSPSSSDNDDNTGDDSPPPPLPPRPRAATVDLGSALVSSPTSLASDSPADFTKSSTALTNSPTAFSPTNNNDSSTTTPPIHRKPAPALHPLPRYSMIVNDRPAALAGIRHYNTVPLDGELDYDGGGGGGDECHPDPSISVRMDGADLRRERESLGESLPVYQERERGVGDGFGVGDGAQGSGIGGEGQGGEHQQHPAVEGTGTVLPERSIARKPVPVPGSGSGAVGEEKGG